MGEQMGTRSSINFAVKKYGCPKVAVEIGVNMGENSRHILTTYPIEFLVLVDPYIPYVDKSGREFEMIETMEKHREIMLEVLKPFYDRIVIMFAPSIIAARLFPDNFFDYIYIDANHTYEGVSSDITTWYPKLKDKRIFAGHDCGAGNFPGVRQAVEEFCKIYNYRPTFGSTDTDWYIEKGVPYVASSEDLGRG
jgi:hypothetical protein